MIKPTQKRLTIIFTTIIIVFSGLIMTVSFSTLNRSLLNSLKNHINNDVEDEFIQLVRDGDFSTLEGLREDEVFQVYDRQRQLVSGTNKFRSFNLPLNEELLDGAFRGEHKFETVKYKNDRYLVSYVQITDKYAGRVSLALTSLIEYEKNFWHLVALMLPIGLAVSFFVSWYLVRQAMKPIADIFTFQENFSSNVTHELRSPLASLKGNLEVALRRDRSTDEYRETLRLGLKEVDRIVELINNLYMLASSKFRPLEILRRDANLKGIMFDAIDFFSAQISEKNITVDTSGLNAVNCACDETLMRRAIYNLIDNAVKYTPQGGKIKLGLVKNENGVSMTISNTCDRVNKDEIKNFFEPFYRGENALTRDIEGKGLGLYIARYIIRSHGGDITIKASEDGMCTIEISHCGK